MDGYIGEIRAFGFRFAPQGWATCNGATLPITQQQALFSLLSFRFGGNNRDRFQLPNLSGWAAMGTGTGQQYSIASGATVGNATESLTAEQMPAHNHSLQPAYSANYPDPTGVTAAPVAGAYFDIIEVVGSHSDQEVDIFASQAQPTTALSSLSVSGGGGNLPHNNMQPFLAMNYCICLNGYYPLKP